MEGQEKLAILGVILLKSLAYPIVDSATKCWVRRVFPGPKLTEKFKFGVRFQIHGESYHKTWHFHQFLGQNFDFSL